MVCTEAVIVLCVCVCARACVCVCVVLVVADLSEVASLYTTPAIKFYLRIALHLGFVGLFISQQ